MLQVGLVLGVHWPAGAGEWFLLAAFSLIGVIAAARAHITGVGLLTAALAVVAFLIIGSVAIFFLSFEPRGLAHRWNLFKAYYRLWPFGY